MVRQPPPVAPVPRLWPGRTVVCLGTGPSLTQADVDACEGCHAIAVNDAYRLAPWAPICYAADHRWWRLHYEHIPASMRKISIMPDGHEVAQQTYPDIQILRNTGRDGLELEPNGLRTGINSGYQAINLAVHLGARRIVLLGYDMQNTDGRRHFFGDHPGFLHQHSRFGDFLTHFATLPAPLAAAGVTILNATRTTALTVFPRVSLAEALQTEVLA